MAKPFPPEIVGPLSKYSTLIQVRGNEPGATITVTQKPTHGSAQIASFIAAHADGEYTIGMPLSAGAAVSVAQTTSDGTSDGSLQTIVQDAPAELSAMTLLTHVHEAGRALLAQGVVPGATVKGQIGSATIGPAAAASGLMLLEFTNYVAANQTIQLTQTVGAVSKSQSTPPAIGLGRDKLAPPVIQGPLVDCQTTLAFSGVIDGATLQMCRNTQSGTPENTWVSAVDADWFWIKPLVEGDRIYLRQGFMRDPSETELEIHSDWAAMTVGAAAAPAPTFLATPTAGAQSVFIGNLIPGARVAVSQIHDGQHDDLGQAYAGAPTALLMTPPLVGGATLHVRQAVCPAGGGGPAGIATVVTPPRPGDVQVLVSTLYPCAAYVYARFTISSGGFVLGGLIAFITDGQGRQRSGYVPVPDPDIHGDGGDALMPVSPGLAAGETLFVNVIFGDGSKKALGPFTVGPSEDAPEPSIYKPQAGRDFVLIDSKAAGARLDVFVETDNAAPGAFVGSIISRGEYGPNRVELATPLVLGQTVYCVQTLCGKSKTSKLATVTDQTPHRPKLIAPHNGATAVPATAPVIFRWIDEAANTPAAARSFALKIGNDAPETVTHPHAQSMPFDTQITWSVTASNNSGTPETSEVWSFRTAKRPPASLAFATGHVDGSQNPVFSIQVKNFGDATSSAWSVKFSAKAGLANEQHTTASKTFHGAPLHGGATATAHVTFDARISGETVVVDLMTGTTTLQSTHVLVPF